MIHRLQKLSSHPLEIVWHENKATYISVRKIGGRLFLRLHRLFHDAPTPVLQAIIQFALKRDARSRAIIRQMAHLHFSRAPSEPRALASQGKAYDLQEIFNRINEPLKLEGISIGWSTKSPRGKFRSMTFGCFDGSCRQIRINPLLDSPQVPLYFIEFIVYHEALHAVCPPRMDASGRAFIHTREFREKERQFPQFEAAKKWEKGSLKFFKQGIYGRS